ncbi:hypothetical protein AVEN_164439-1 [Araneus ventricosus]|uniref:Uncharacterized protein n=1 Tax=Araneus ventricosus TaxID=182803 RepID=A0A4Y2VWP8_ARAVE|nr:hypothetical protein AVEN_164439-1 [Araneus ventricosus]
MCVQLNNKNYKTRRGNIRLQERQKHLDRILTDVEARLAQNKKAMKEQISTNRPPKRRRENDVSEDEDSEEDGPQR